MDFLKTLQLLEAQQEQEIILPTNDPKYKQIEAKLAQGRIKTKKPLKKTVSADKRTVSFKGTAEDLKQLG